jgi:O-antigen/teichoic acid export membrane protein
LPATPPNDATSGGSAGAQAPENAAAEAGRVMRNAFIVSVSLAVTWSVALLVRLVLPRRLGPDLFGEYRFAEALAMNGLGFVSLGIDVYIQKEFPRRPEHASDFYGGVQAFRVLGSVVILAALGFITRARGFPDVVVAAVLLFGVAQLFLTLANTHATMLYAARRVGRLSALNIGTKLVWGVGIALSLLRHAGLWAYAVASVVSEGVRFVALYRITRKTLPLRVAIDAKRTFEALKLSAPFYLNQLAVALYANIDAAIMGLLVSDREVGYYGAATNISNVAMLMAPFFGWVLMPQLSRAAARREEFVAMMRRSVEWTVTLVFPLALAMGLGADTIIHTVFGSRFEASIPAMRTLAPMYALVYLAMLGATCLILLERSWTTTLVTLASFVANALLNVFVIPVALRRFGEGGAGIGAAAVWVSTEAGVVVTHMILLRRVMFDRRNVTVMLKSLFACALVVGIHFWAVGLGELRLLLDGTVYMVVVLATRAVRLGELRELARIAWRQRRNTSTSGA